MAQTHPSRALGHSFGLRHPTLSVGKHAPQQKSVPVVRLQESHEYQGYERTRLGNELGLWCSNHHRWFLTIGAAKIPFECGYLGRPRSANGRRSFSQKPSHLADESTHQIQ